MFLKMYFSSIPLVLAAAIALAQAQAAVLNPYDEVAKERVPPKDPLVIDLGYAIYNGFTDANSSLRVWKGLHYATPPLNSLRFKAPEVPKINRGAIQHAWTDPPACIQSSQNSSMMTGNMRSSEDCLFLNVFAPANASELPVFVWIHGGGYQGGSAATFDPASLMETGENGFVSVIIQYRLGAFGFLSSEEVKDQGGLNAGILDQQLTLQWIQKYIGTFGGDPRRVTIAGESAGAGSVMIHATAYGGTQANTLFENAITASPFLPQTFHYNSQVILEQYWDFAQAAGCARLDTLKCLQAAKSDSLIVANAEVASKALSGIFAWKPVIDGTLIPQLLSKTLDGQLNGKSVLTGNNANEGFAFTPQNITTQAAFAAYLQLYFPRLSAENLTLIQSIYTTPADILDSATTPQFATSGLSGPTAVNQSQLSTGHQQVANNFYAEVTFACPSYWLAAAYERAVGNASFQYQFSVTPALHGFDVGFYFPSPARPVDEGVSTAFQKAYAGFVVDGVPADWPRKTEENPVMRNLNATGGTPVDMGLFTAFVDPGVKVAGGVVDADIWEGGRRMRCNFLRSLADELMI